jgi:hypothetical protein
LKVDCEGLPNRVTERENRAPGHRHDPPAERELRDQQGGDPAESFSTLDAVGMLLTSGRS